MNFLAAISISAAQEVTGITIKLQEWNGSIWSNVGDQTEVSPNADTCLDAGLVTATDVITTGSHGFVDEEAVHYVSSAGNVMTGLTDNTTYYIRYIDADTFTLAATAGGAKLDLTQPAGGDTHYFTSVKDLEIRLNIQNSSDEAQLPLWPQVRVVVDSGASDSITISDIRMARRRR